MLLSVYLCFAMWFVPMQQGSTNQLQATSLSILANGGFESGLLNWGLIDSGDGSTRVSGSFFHSGANSLMLDLNPTSMITKSQVQGAQQSATVQELRGLLFEAWFMTPLCSFLPGITGRVLIQVEGFAVHYDVDATCGVWKRLNRNVTADFQAEFGSDGQRLFQLDRPVSILVALELVRSAPDAMALAEYSSIYWDDVSATASIESATAMSSTATSTSTSEAIATRTSGTAGSATTSQLKTTLASQAGSLNWMGFIVVAGLSMSSIMAVLTVAAVISRRRAIKKPYVMIHCPSCNRLVRLYPDTGYCTQCGVSLAGSVNLSAERRSS
jgi:hypothetical protein